jgi:hypothetical protein
MKIRSKIDLYPHMYFTEHLMGAFEKSPQKSNLNHESSSLLVRRLKNNTGSSPATHTKQLWSRTPEYKSEPK